MNLLVPNCLQNTPKDFKDPTTSLRSWTNSYKRSGIVEKDMFGFGTALLKSWVKAPSVQATIYKNWSRVGWWELQLGPWTLHSSHWFQQATTKARKALALDRQQIWASWHWHDLATPSESGLASTTGESMASQDKFHVPTFQAAHNWCMFISAGISGDFCTQRKSHQLISNSLSIHFEWE